jgi:tetratricopeptide (TPR) repeat protein
MHSYMMQSHGDEFGPFPLEFLRKRLAAAHFHPRMVVEAVEDGKHIAYSNVGDVILAQDNLSDALSTFQAYFAEAKRRAGASPSFAPAQTELAIAYQKLGDVLSTQGKVDDAIKNYRAALAVVEKLATHYPRHRHHQIDVAEFNYDLAFNGDEPARRYALVVETLAPLAQDLDRRKTQLLAEAKAALARFSKQ